MGRFIILKRYMKTFLRINQKLILKGATKIQKRYTLANHVLVTVMVYPGTARYGISQTHLIMGYPIYSASGISHNPKFLNKLKLLRKTH